MSTVRSFLFVAVFAAAGASMGCQSEGACVMPSAGTEICTLQKKGVCEQGNGHKFVGGECPAAGFPKKSKDGYWDK